ncbi:hypothetical protein [Breoghania sp.]|uniref:hypothetical protein n=1 Tax=Breoghania sp. TaxID=2065378 RepID=UPI002AA7C737|nr:hypothetical protein [Breoghania sp.]
MHRSGTSALARVVNLLGYDLPNTLIGAAPSNETGHWESLLVQRFNDELLKSISSFWFDWRDVDPDWFASPAAAEFREKGRDVLAQEYGASSAIVLKDPRICRILPFWLELLTTSDFRPVVVIPLRNPVEVAASLKKRNGFELQAGYLMWLRHVLDAEVSSRGVPRFFTDYDSLLDDWRGMVVKARMRLGIDWPQDPDAVSDQIDAFLSDKYRHHHENGDELLQKSGFPTWMRDAFRVFTKWIANGESERDYATLDRIRQELNGAKDTFGWLVDSQVRQSMRVNRLETQLAQSQAEIESARQELEMKGVVLPHRDDATTQSKEDRDMSANLAAKTKGPTAPSNLAGQGLLGAKEPEADPSPLGATREEIAALVRSLPEVERLATNVVKQIAELLSKVDGDPEEELAESVRLEVDSARIELEEQLREARAETERVLAEKRLVEDSLQRRFDEIALLTQAVIDRDARLTDAAEKIRRAVTGLRESAGPSIRDRLSGIRQKMWRLKQSGLFDAQWYLAQNKDVAEAGVDPLFHYVCYGANEGRHPNPQCVPPSKISEL